MAFVDQYRLVLAAGDLLALHATDDRLHKIIKKVSTLRRQRLAKRPDLFMTPFVKMPHMHPVT